MRMGGGWVIELDIRKFFDSLSHSHLRRILEQRVRDGVLRRSIDKWLAAGVMEGAQLSLPDAGTPQGGVISPLLANVYLHEVLDRWFEGEIRPRLRGQGWLVRFADDAVFVFTAEADARQVMALLPERFQQHGLTLHPTKTRLLCFQPRSGRDEEPPQPDSRSFDFLGFIHLWRRFRRGGWVVKRKTASSRFNRALKRISAWLRRYRHEPVRWQHQQLVAKLRGHDNYYGLAGNSKSLARFPPPDRARLAPVARTPQSPAGDELAALPPHAGALSPATTAGRVVAPRSQGDPAPTIVCRLLFVVCR